ncbi:unnamed protein product [Sympodiomycopsis kandeliae]
MTAGYDAAAYDKENIDNSAASSQSVKFPSEPTSKNDTESNTESQSQSSRNDLTCPSSTSLASSSTSMSSAPDSSTGSAHTPLKQKRSTVFHGSEAFKAKTNQKPFSKSAAKRESVMALGSIGHLQNFYAKQGFAARQPNARLGGKLALGPGALGASQKSGTPADALAALEGRTTTGVTRHDTEVAEGDEDEDHSSFPSSDSQNIPVTTSTWKGRLPPDVPKPVEADLSRLWIGMIEALDDTCQSWDLFGQMKSTPLPKSRNPSSEPEKFQPGGNSSNGLPSGVGRNPLLLDVTSVDSTTNRLSQASLGSSDPSKTSVDLLEVINGTTKTIRAVRNYLFALPPLPRLTRTAASATSSTAPAVDDGHFASGAETSKQTTAVEPAAPQGSLRASSVLRKKPSIQFTNEEHGSTVKPQDAFRRQGSLHNTSKANRRRSFIGATGFVTDLTDQDSSEGRNETGGVVAAGNSGSRKPGGRAARAEGSSSHAPSSFVPFETVQDRRRNSMRLSMDDDAEREAFRQSFNLTDGPNDQSAGIGRGLPSGLAQAATLPASREESPQRRATAPVMTNPPSTQSQLSSTFVTANAVQDDPLVVVRSSALEVLGMLRSLEEKSRVTKVPDSWGPSSRPRLPSTVSIRMMRDYSEGGESWTPGPKSLDAPNARMPMRIPKEDADEEVEGFLYRTDITLRSLEKEREIVSKYLGIVDSVLASVGKAKELRKYMRGNLNAEGVVANDADVHTADSKLSIHLDSTGTEDEEKLPLWARKDFTGDGFSRLHSLLLDVLPDLPPEVLIVSPNPDGEPNSLVDAQTHLLSLLSDGQILCHAYNASLRRSGRPWGFIQSSAIHDVKGEEEAYRLRLEEEDYNEEEGSQMRQPQGWTFRRIENLKRFSAAIALRYGIKTSTVKGSSSFITGNNKSSLTMQFEPSRIARMEGNWKEMLYDVVAKWVEMVVEEERGL